MVIFWWASIQIKYRMQISVRIFFDWTIIIMNKLLFEEEFLFVSGEEYASMPPVFHIEDYDTCMLMGEKALYCYIKFKLKPIESVNESRIWKVIKVKSCFVEETTIPKIWL